MHRNRWEVPGRLDPPVSSISMGYAFDNETAVRRVETDLWTAHVSDQWSIGANPNGGYLAAIVLRAMQQLGPHSSPISVTSHFLRPGTGNAQALVRTELLRSGRSVTTARGTLEQGGKSRVEVIAAFGHLSASPEGDEIDIACPEIAPPEECVPRDGAKQGVELPLMNRIEMLLPPGTEVGGSGRAESIGWIRLSDGREPDPLVAMLFTDAFPPSIFGKLGLVGWVPTIEMTIHIRRRPAPGWMLGQFRTTDLSDKRLVEDGLLWDSEGRLVAQIRQIGMLLT